MFDERSSIWIKIYKAVVIILAFAIIILGVLWAADEACPTYQFSMVDLDFPMFAKYSGIVLIVAFAELASGMLTVNFFNNVQAIREKLDKQFP